MKSIKKGIKNFISDISIIITSILLIIVYITAVGLTSILAKLTGKKFLDEREKQTYWSDLNLKEKPLEEYYKQF